MPTIENYAECEYHFPKIDQEKVEGGAPGVTVAKPKWDIHFPGARPGKDGRGQDTTVPSVTAVSDEQLAAMKADRVMADWFGNGKLLIVEPRAHVAKAAAAK